jgi:hypothetical protein
MKKTRKIALIAGLSLAGLVLLLIAVSAISNLSLPQSSPVVETLSAADKIRLAETIHLRQTLGNAVWPGWGQADIPAIVYNEAYAFLIGYPQPPAGWVKVPSGPERGGEWEIVPGDTFNGQPYYRQLLPDPNITPQAFTVLVGQHWVSSLQTLDWTKIGLVKTIRQDLPSFLRPIFPYYLFIGQLLSGDDQYISLTAHEAFHAYEGMMALDKLAAAENANLQVENQYPWDDASLRADWQTELDLLTQALKTTDPTAVAGLARQFLNIRAARRTSAGLSAQLIGFEQQREWLEGLARYAELEIWRQAARSGYQPIPDTAQLPDFNNYTGFDARWSREIDQISRMADDRGDGRFYYTGMAQAFLLDRLMPDWKVTAFNDGVWLENLLSEAIQGQK